MTTTDGRGERPLPSASQTPSPKWEGFGEPARVKRMTASEREALMRLNVAFEIMALDVLEPLAERMKMIPGARRDLAMMSKRITKIIEAVPGTIPDNQLKTYLNNLKMVSYTIGVKHPGKLERDEKKLWHMAALRDADGAAGRVPRPLPDVPRGQGAAPGLRIAEGAGRDTQQHDRPGGRGLPVLHTAVKEDMVKV